jgi:glutamyl-tRNA synthetase
MGLFNIRTVGFADGELRAEHMGGSTPEENDAPILQWVPTENKLPVSVMLPDGTERTGFAEEDLKSEPVGSVVQFVRFGFCRLDERKHDRVTMYFTHD